MLATSSCTGIILVHQEYPHRTRASLCAESILVCLEHPPVPGVSSCARMMDIGQEHPHAPGASSPVAPLQLKALRRLSSVPAQLRALGMAKVGLSKEHDGKSEARSAQSFPGAQLPRDAMRALGVPVPHMAWLWQLWLWQLWLCLSHRASQKGKTGKQARSS